MKITGLDVCGNQYYRGSVEGSKECVRLLVNAGANIELLDSNQKRVRNQISVAVTHAALTLNAGAGI
jgi:hypothetical protein